MITEFDKNGVAKLLKKQFNECVRNCDYEDALDVLLKYADETEYADFHLTCGTLYLLMTQDSDDNELLTLAFREFMMHIARFPKCSVAYRNLLVVEFLRDDTRGALSVCAAINRHGLDLEYILTEVAQAQLLFISPEAPANIDMLLAPGDFGTIDEFYEDKAPKGYSIPPSYARSADGETVNTEKSDGAPDFIRDKFVDVLNGKSGGSDKILRFRGGTEKGSGIRGGGRVIDFGGSDAKERELSEFRTFLDKLGVGYEFVDDCDEDYSDGDDVDDLLSKLLDEIMFIVADDYVDDEMLRPLRAYDEFDETWDLTCAASNGMHVSPDREDGAIHSAMVFLSENNPDAALRDLDKIDSDSEKYYFALAVRGMIFFAGGKEKEAEAEYLKAIDMYRDRALANLMLCELYEKQGKFERIPPLLENIDEADFPNTETVYKAYRFALKYCAPKDAIELIAGYIDEFNIFEMRIVYAQMLYNDGRREDATDELYKLTRIFYDDLNTAFFYFMAKLGVDKMPMETEAPQEIVAVLVEHIMDIVNSGQITEDIFDDVATAYGVEFFITLEFRNDWRVVKRMFDTVRNLAKNVFTQQKMRDALVSPYVEPIVKAVILSELLANSHTDPFVTELSYRPIFSETTVPPCGMSEAFYRAWAYVFMLGGNLRLLPAEAAILNNARSRGGVPDLSTEQEAYYLVRRVIESEKKTDERIVYAMGLDTKASANRKFAETAESVFCGNSSKNQPKET